MARLAGVDLPPTKRAEIGLTYIYGIGRTRSKSLLYRCGIDFNKKIRDLTEDEVNHIRTILEEEGAVEGDLRKEISMNIKRHIEMGSYRGLRHRRGLPVRGQRTHTNARTRKGPRRGLGSIATIAVRQTDHRLTAHFGVSQVTPELVEKLRDAAAPLPIDVHH